jgi:chemotaxis protein CheD
MTTLSDVVIPVGLGELRVAAGEAAVLLALGLGSCVGVALWDASNQVGGMAHVVLPAPPNETIAASNKFASNAVPELVRAVLARGAKKSSLRCVIAGGADVLSAGTLKNLFNIGERNTAAVLAALALEGLRPHQQDCGGKTGRSFRLTLPEGRAAVRRLGSDWQEM